MDDPAAYQLSAEAHRAVLASIVERLFLGVEESPDPVVVIVGGQNGAGKSTTHQRLVTEISPLPAVVDGDEIRIDHPGWLSLSRQDPVLANAATYHDMKAWITACEEFAIARRCNVIIETTLRQLEPLNETLDRFRRAGYRRELDVVAVPPEVSAAGVVSRFEQAHADRGFARHVPLEIHDQAAAAIKPSTAALENERLVEVVRVRHRSGEVVYTNTLTPTGWKQPPAADRAVADLQRDLRPHLDATEASLTAAAELMALRSPTPEQAQAFQTVTRRWKAARPPRPRTRNRSDTAPKTPDPRHRRPRNPPKPKRGQKP